MSEVDQTLNTGSQATTNYDVSKIFIYENRFQTESYTNDGYDPVTLAVGTVMGRVSSTGKIIPLQSNASDGSQFPVGILNREHVVNEGDTVDVSICIGGDVAAEKIVLVKSGDTLDTVISGRRIRDRIAGDTLGIKLVTVDEMTGFDNQ